MADASRARSEIDRIRAQFAREDATYTHTSRKVVTTTSKTEGAAAPLLADRVSPIARDGDGGRSMLSADGMSSEDAGVGAGTYSSGEVGDSDEGYATPQDYARQPPPGSSSSVLSALRALQAKIRALEEENAQLRSTEGSLRDELDALKHQQQLESAASASSHTVEVSRLRQLHSQATSEKATLAVQLDACREQVRSLKAELEFVQAQAQAKAAETRTNGAQLDGARSALADAQDTITEMKTTHTLEITEARRVATEYRAQFEDATAETIRCKNALQNLLKLHQSLVAKLERCSCSCPSGTKKKKVVKRRRGRSRMRKNPVDAAVAAVTSADTVLATQVCSRGHRLGKKVAISADNADRRSSSCCKSKSSGCCPGAGARCGPSSSSSDRCAHGAAVTGVARTKKTTKRSSTRSASSSGATVPVRGVVSDAPDAKPWVDTLRKSGRGRSPSPPGRANVHDRLESANGGPIPFILGKSTGRSHSVYAAVQSTLADPRAHGNAQCSDKPCAACPASVPSDVAPTTSASSKAAAFLEARAAAATTAGAGESKSADPPAPPIGSGIGGGPRVAMHTNGDAGEASDGGDDDDASDAPLEYIAAGLDAVDGTSGFECALASGPSKAGGALPECDLDAVIAALKCEFEALAERYNDTVAAATSSGTGDPDITSKLQELVDLMKAKGEQLYLLRRSQRGVLKSRPRSPLRNPEAAAAHAAAMRAVKQLRELSSPSRS